MATAYCPLHFEHAFSRVMRGSLSAQFLTAKLGQFVRCEEGHRMLPPHAGKIMV